MDVSTFYKKRGKRKQCDASSDKDTRDDKPKTARNSKDGGEHLQQKASQFSHRSKSHLVPAPLWKVFPRQRMAFDFARTCWQDTAVFAFESEDFGHEGQRKYLVTTYYEFGRQYLSRKQPRHFYEIITEGSACHLYFDIEFKLEYNKSVIPLKLLEIFIEYVCRLLLEQFNIVCDRTNILDLDSSTESKFSRHLVFHLPHAAFRNNIHAGNFVHFACNQLRKMKSTTTARACTREDDESGITNHVTSSGSNLLSLFVMNERQEEVLICDEGVYTKNRNFRLFLSSKLRKKVPLVIAKENQFLSSYAENLLQQKKSRRFNTLMDSMICNVRFEKSCKVLEFMSSDSKQRGSGSRQMSDTSGASMGPVPGSLEEGYQCSPYPTVDHFITSRLTVGGVQGSIRRWTFFPQGKLLVFDILHNRWCENIGRPHKSNNIMIVADLSKGIYYQKCHDPDCKRVNFRSQDYIIPSEINPVVISNDVETVEEGIDWVTQLSDEDMKELQRDYYDITSDEEAIQQAAADMDCYIPALGASSSPPCKESAAHSTSKSSTSEEHDVQVTSDIKSHKVEERNLLTASAHLPHPSDGDYQPRANVNHPEPVVVSSLLLQGINKSDQTVHYSMTEDDDIFCEAEEQWGRL